MFIYTGRIVSLVSEVHLQWDYQSFFLDQYNTLIRIIGHLILCRRNTTPTLAYVYIIYLFSETKKLSSPLSSSSSFSEPPLLLQMISLISHKMSNIQARWDNFSLDQNVLIFFPFLFSCFSISSYTYCLGCYYASDLFGPLWGFDIFMLVKSFLLFIYPICFLRFRVRKIISSHLEEARMNVLFNSFWAFCTFVEKCNLCLLQSNLQ